MAVAQSAIGTKSCSSSKKSENEHGYGNVKVK